jgi:hypothetical protein
MWYVEVMLSGEVWVEVGNEVGWVVGCVGVEWASSLKGLHCIDVGRMIGWGLCCCVVVIVGVMYVGCWLGVLRRQL